METQANAQQLQTKIKVYIDELARETDLARKSEVMQKYLDFVSKFHQYSANNIWLILMTRPDATYVAGYQSWKKLNRWVRKGEKGIPIFAPLIHKDDPDTDNSPRKLSGFRIVFVFDVSQTEGEPLPPVPNWKSPEKNAELNEKLMEFAQSRGIEITFKNLPGDIQGISKGKVIEVDNDAGTKTMIHEIAHELMHRGDDCPRGQAIRELQAEATAFVVAKHFGIQGLNSSNYLALFNIDSTNICKNNVDIQKTASTIINFIKGYHPCG